MTDEELFAFLSKAEEMNYENWKTYRVLYNAELGRLQDRIERLEKALREIADCNCEKWCGNYFDNCIDRAALGEKKDG